MRERAACLGLSRRLFSNTSPMTHLHGPREHTGVVQMKACDDGHHATRVLLPCSLGQS